MKQRSVAALFRQYNAAYNRGDYDQALKLLDEVIALDPQNATAYSWRADIKADQENYEGAAADAEAGAKIDRALTSRMYTYRGQALEQKGDLQGALEAYSQGFEHVPDSVWLPFYRADLRARLGDNEGARADYTTVIERSPSYALAFEKRARIHFVLGNLENALDDANHAVRLSPRSAEFLYARGCVRREMRDYDGAIADFSKALKLEPKLALALEERAKTYQLKGETGRAEADQKQAENVASEAIIEVRTVYKGSNQPELPQRRRLLNLIMLLIVPILLIFLQLARNYLDNQPMSNLDDPAYVEPGDESEQEIDLAEIEAQLQAYTERIERDPTNIYALVGRCTLYASLGKNDLALADCNRAVEAAPEDGYVYYARGMVYMMLQNYDAAIADVEQAGKLDPEKYDAKTMIAMINAMRGR